MDSVVVKKKWGFEYCVFKDGINVHVLHIDKGEETSFHCHNKKNVLMVLLKGRARMRRDGENTDYLDDLELKPMFFRQIPMGIYHQTIAIEDCVVMEIESTSDVHDLVRKTDKYNRQQGYEVKDIIAVDDIVRWM